MKILWISNIPIGKMATVAGCDKQASGSWLNASLQAFIGDPDNEIIVATVGKSKALQVLREGNVTYCTLPGGNIGSYDYASKNNRCIWKEIKETFKPDLVHVWGTEFTPGYIALDVLAGIPTAIFMQGILGQIARYYCSGITDSELRKAFTPRDLIKWDWIKCAQKKLIIRSHIEVDMIQRAGNVIVENLWCGMLCRAVDPNCSVYTCKLPIRDEFFMERWLSSSIEPFSIMSNSGSSPIKGLHVLLKAFKMVVDRYPQAKLYVPGTVPLFGKTPWQLAKMDGYTKYLRSLITKLGLKDKVKFLGILCSGEMAKRMATSNVFVMPSSIENHSSTLIEAMIVGTPSISSYVGGIPEYLENNKNGILYRFEEHEVLAAQIVKVFQEPRYAEMISKRARESMRIGRNAVDLKERLLSIYKQIQAKEYGRKLLRQSPGK